MSCPADFDIMKTVVALSFSASWVILLLHNPPLSDMDYTRGTSAYTLVRKRTKEKSTWRYCLIVFVATPDSHKDNEREMGGGGRAGKQL